MKPLPVRKRCFWGEEYDIIPYLIDAIHGDGKQWMWFGYLEDRPSFYVARVDSSFDPGSGFDGDPSESIIGWLEDQILDEAMEFFSDEEYEEYSKKGYLDDGGNWPIPPLEMACGSQWGRYKPDENEVKNG